MQFSEFRAKVNAALIRNYAAGIDDLGLDDEPIKGFWVNGSVPTEYVDWIAGKYDLTTIREFKTAIISQLSISLLADKRTKL